MMNYRLSLLALWSTVLVSVTANKFVLSKSLVGHQFFDAFTWETFDDPTHGAVVYTGLEDAKKLNLTYATHNSFVMHADDTTVLAPDAVGRRSIRITSLATYEDSITVIDLKHMPAGCATWPAFWTFSQTEVWPAGGEIDIIEGANTQTENWSTLHTLPGCNMTQKRHQTGTTVSTVCDVNVNFNQGCQTQFNTPKSYGAGFNAVGGGWYAMKRTYRDGVWVWFWARDDPTVPDEVRFGKSQLKPNPSAWGTPGARFPPDECNFKKFFDAHQMVFDLTFCGDLAGNLYASSGCGADIQACRDFVLNNPSSFKEAYWDIKSLRIYTPKP